MQALSSLAVEREPAEQDDARNRVGGLGEAGAREVVIDEALRAEAGEESLGDPLIQVEVNGVFGEDARRPRRPPGGSVPRGASRRASGSACGASVACPGWRPSSGRSPRAGRAAGRSRRGGRDSSCVSASGSAPSRSREQESASRNGSAAKAAQSRDVSSSVWQRAICFFRSSWRSRADSSSSCGDALAFGVEVCLFDLARQALGVAVADARPQPALDLVVDDLGQAAELALDGLGLADENFEHPVLGALRQDEVVAADLFGRLELAVDAAVALLDAARVPGEIEVEEVGAVGLEVEAFARGVGGEQDT